MKQIFSESTRLQKCLDVEAALALAHAELGTIPNKHATEIAKHATVAEVKLSRVKEIEAQIKHDVMAMVKALAEVCGHDAGKFVHLGATSADITDTATALQLRDAIKILQDDLIALRNAIFELAQRYKSTLMIGRTHGQSALPITFGLKMAVYTMEVQRHIERLRETATRIVVGKMSGAVGTGAAFGNNFIKLQQLVMDKLKIGVEDASTQIIQRDRYIEFISLLANIATTAEKFATELRNLQRSEIGEVSEPFDRKKQVGSSTMAHKRNPVVAERICGLARIVRALLTPCYESAILWHERDLTNSAAERFIIPHACILTDDILQDLAGVFRNLEVYPEVMLRNVKRAGDVIMAEAVMIALTEKGMGRQEAHELVRQCAMAAESSGASFRSILIKDEKVTALLSEHELDTVLDPKNYIGNVDQIIDTIAKKIKVNIDIS